MPCYKCSNGKWRIGDGKCMYKTKANCERALAAYYANKKEKLQKVVKKSTTKRQKVLDIEGENTL